MEFVLAESKLGKAVWISSNKLAHAIEAPQISFSSDGFAILAVPVISSFDQQFIGSMANMAVAKLDDDQWKLWRVFQQSGVVTASTAFVDARIPTEGLRQISRIASGNRIWSRNDRT